MFYRDFFRMPIRDLPVWAKIGVVVFVGSTFAIGSHHFPVWEENILFGVGFASLLPVVCFIAYKSLTAFTATRPSAADEGTEND